MATAPFKPASFKGASSIWQTPPRQNVWQWAADNVDFSREPRYDTEYKAPYDPDYMPFFKEPAECVTDRDVKECWVLKCSRAGASENLLLNPIRYSVAVKPQPTLYVTASVESAERMMEERIKLGLNLATDTRAKLKAARQREHEIIFDDMPLFTTWPTSKTGFKQSGYSLILADEVSLFKGFSTDMMRRRTGNYTFSTIMGISSPDPSVKRPSDQDPIFIEHDLGDRRKWVMDDPGGKGGFSWGMGTGGRDGWGLKWDSSAKDPESGDWDYRKVHETAHFITPSGARLTEPDRRGMTSGGRWVPTNPNAPVGVRSYHVNAFMIPFASCSFGDIAVAFLKAKRGGSVALRTFIYEYLAEPFALEIERTQDDQLYERQAGYEKGKSLPEVMEAYKGDTGGIIIGADVQKHHIFYVARYWSASGDSGLVEWGNVVGFQELADVADRLGAVRVITDAGYRKLEVYEAAMQFQFIPVIGREGARLNAPFKKQVIDPYEGTRNAGAGRNMGMYVIDVDMLKDLLFDMMQGRSACKWMLYQSVEAQYVRQVIAEEKRDGKYAIRRGFKHNHLGDCENYSLFGAIQAGYYRPSFLQVAEEN